MTVKIVRIAAWGFGAYLALGSLCRLSASSLDPPDPSSSCASAEYATEKAPPPTDRTSSPILIVVPGKSPINTTNEISLGRPVTVCVMGLHNWIYIQKKSPATLRMAIAGHIFNAAPSAVGPSNQEYLNFILRMDSADSNDWKAWAAILDASRHSQSNYSLPISLALADTKEILETKVFAEIIPYPPGWYYLLILFIALLAALAYLAAKTELLRYTVGLRPSPPLNSPFSLALVQMAFWFYLSLAAYVYICVTTRQVHIPMGSVLGLLGISSSTGLAAVLVDKQKNATAQGQRGSLAAERDALIARIRDLVSVGVTPGSAVEAEISDKRSRLAQVNASINQLPAPPAPPISKGFLDDLLSDGDGISFHRFQIAIWTIVLGIVFVWSGYRNISMPEFDASLLTLMGISSGTYVGFKFPEKPKA